MKMAQPNVAREPSMEEILASIRRIIESNDPEGAKGFSPSLPPLYDGDEDEDHGPVRLTIEEEVAEEAFYATTAEEAPMTMAAPAVPQATEASLDAENSAPKNISLADLAARVRAAAN